MRNFEQRGGCMCGNTRYLLNAEPITTYACHGTGCQTRTGSAFGISMIVSAERLKLTAGTTQAWESVRSGREEVLEQCSEYGTNLLATIVVAPEIVAIWPGSLDDTSWVKPKAHIWTKSAQSWVKFGDSDVIYDEQPKDIAELFSL